MVSTVALALSFLGLFRTRAGSLLRWAMTDWCATICGDVITRRLRGRSYFVAPIVGAVVALAVQQIAKAPLPFG